MDFLRSCVSLLILAILSPATQSLRFELQSGRTKCTGDEVKVNAMAVGKYHVVNPNEGHPLPPSHKITVKVTSPHGISFHEADKVESGQFGFTSGETGDFLTCFTAVDHQPGTTITIEFDWKTGVHTKDWSNVAKKGHVDSMEYSVKMLLDTVTSINDEMFYLREREEEMQDLNIATNTKMAWLSLLSLVICLSVAGLQLWHLKTFFEKKKII